MIREMLTLLFVEKLTLEEAARKLTVPVEDVRGRLEMLEHMGYIKGFEVSGGSCSGDCLKCALTPACPDEEEGRTEGGFSWYELTEKGRRLVGN